MSPSRRIPQIAAAAAFLALTTSAPALALPAEDTPSPSASQPAPTAPPNLAPGSPTVAPTTQALTGPARQWAFFQNKGGTWTSVPDGPYSVLPEEGTVEGWRFSAAAADAPRAPRATPTFDEVCGKVAGEAGKKRVAVVVDYGRDADGPEGVTPPAAIARCAVIPATASSAEALAAAALPRDEGGRVCAVDGYPAATGCAQQLKALPAGAEAADAPVNISVAGVREQPRVAEAPAAATEEGPSRGLITGIAVVIVALAGALAFVLRRRRPADSTAAPAATTGGEPAGSGATAARAQDVTPRDGDTV